MLRTADQVPSLRRKIDPSPFARRARSIPSAMSGAQRPLQRLRAGATTPWVRLVRTPARQAVDNRDVVHSREAGQLSGVHAAWGGAAPTSRRPVCVEFDCRSRRRRRTRERLEVADVALELGAGRRQLRPMCTGRSSPAFMRAYTVVRPMRRTVAASSGVSKRASAARTSWSRCGSPMPTSPRIEPTRPACWQLRHGAGAVCRRSPVRLQPTTEAVLAGTGDSNGGRPADWRSPGALPSAHVRSPGEVGASPVLLQDGL